ncbi:MAG: N-acetylmuramoyl-L-alanine amidase [Clostridia bacterium]|nr:N-acetylmuramoyl-L-alanine amidase [Clostridia bacterium]
MNFKKYQIALFMFVITVFSLFFAEHGILPVSGNRKTVIVIDAGHGLPDGGAVGKSGTPESDINLEVSLLLQKELESRGYEIIMTRRDENGIYKNAGGSIKEKKREDMKNRLGIAQKSHADLFISIHMNFFGEANSSGPQVFYKAGSESGERAAVCIRESFIKNIGSHCTREIKPVTDGIYLLREVKIPAVLVECGFLSNPDEETLLLTPGYQIKMSNAIANGIDEYFKN